MPFDHCKQCKKCCHLEPGYPALEIPLLPAEALQWNQLVIEDRCRFLKSQGCSLGATKPLACEQYPLVYDPGSDRYFFDADCPLYETYQKELSISGSEAEQHFKRIDQRLQSIKREKPEFLQHNFELDVDYFELLPLATPQKARAR